MIFGKTHFFSFLLMLVDFGCVGAAAGGPERSGPIAREMFFGKTHFFSFLLMSVDFGCGGRGTGKIGAHWTGNDFWKNTFLLVPANVGDSISKIVVGILCHQYLHSDFRRPQNVEV